jgi:rubrerythrin
MTSIKLPVTYDPVCHVVWAADGQRLFDLRGSVQMQDERGRFVADCINAASLPDLDAMTEIYNLSESESHLRDENARLVAALDAAEQRERAWTLALQSLTPGGSEFVGDPEYCRNYVDEKILHAHNGIKSAIKERKAAEQRERAAVEKPEDTVLFCPKCKFQHIDKADPDNCEDCGHSKRSHETDLMRPYDFSSNECHDCGCIGFKAWLNPPHKTHRCLNPTGCNHEWRAANIPTNGVEKVEKITAAED